MLFAIVACALISNVSVVDVILLANMRIFVMLTLGIRGFHCSGSAQYRSKPLILKIVFFVLVWLAWSLAGSYASHEPARSCNMYVDGRWCTNLIRFLTMTKIWCQVHSTFKAPFESTIIFFCACWCMSRLYWPLEWQVLCRLGRLGIMQCVTQYYSWSTLVWRSCDAEM